MGFFVQLFGEGMVGLVIFGITVIFLILDIFPMATTAIAGCAAMVLFQVCSFSDAFSSFSSSVIILTIGVMVIGAAIAETGLAEIIGRWIVRVSIGSQIKLIVGTYLIAAVMSAFMTNSAVLAIFLPIIIGVARANTSIKVKNIIMPIAIACVIGGACTLVGSTQQMTAQGLLAEAGVRTFNIFDFLPVGGIILLAGLFYCVFIGFRRGEKIWGARTDVDYDEIKEPNEEIKKHSVITMAIIFLCTVVLYIVDLFPTAITSTLGALACVFSKCIAQKKAFKSVNWNIVGRLAACLGMANALSVSGGTQIISDFFMGIIGTKISPLLLFITFVVLTQLVSEFIANSTAILIVMPIMIVVTSSLNLNTFAFALGMTLASGVALSTPLASSTLGISMSAGFKFNDFFKYNIFLDIISDILIIIFVPLIYGLTI